MAVRSSAQPPPKPRLGAAALVCLAALLAACQAEQPGSAEHGPDGNVEAAGRFPPFVRMKYEPFTRADAVAIAMREWRAFGQPVDDDPPDTRPEPAADDKPERQPGSWERVGEYWWLGMASDRTEAAWTGKHDAAGNEFDARRDGEFAWSAAFISYLMRTAGAGNRFPYASSHATYINIARTLSLGRSTGWAISAEAPDAAAPTVGDLICYSRERARRMHFSDLPAHGFPAHCDIVVGNGGDQLSVLGGNVDDAVTMKHVPLTPEGRLAPPGGRPVDTRYNWIAVIRVAYDR